jgi:hypothetical protein
MIAQFQMEVVEEVEKIQGLMLLNKDVFACGLMFLLGLTEFYQLMEIS